MGYENVGNGLWHGLLEDLINEAARMREEGCTVTTTCSMMEVYNEKIHDLLVPVDKWDTTKVKTAVLPNGINISGHQQRQVLVLDDVLHILKEGDERKTVAATQMNPVSSRGHMVFKLTLDKQGGD